MGNERQQAVELVRKIVEAERLGGGFRIFHDSAIEQIAELLTENRKMKERLKALDELQQSTVQR